MNRAAVDPFAFGRVVEQPFTPPAGQDFVDADPQPNVWASCASCGVAFVRRLGIRMNAPEGESLTWFWSRDCKHKTAGVEMRTSLDEAIA